MKVLNIFTDGASSGNPGPGWAMWIMGKFQISNSKLQIIRRRRVRLDHCTNNDAEYKGVIYALEDLIKHTELYKDYNEIKFNIDSKLVVQQLNGIFKIKHPKMREYVFKVNGLLNQINLPIIFKYIPREENLADALKFD